MHHSYDENQRRLTAGEMHVTVPADAQVRINAWQTDLQRVAKIQQKNDETRSLAQKEAVAMQFCSSGLPTYLQTVLPPSSNTTHAELKKWHPLGNPNTTFKPNLVHKLSRINYISHSFLYMEAKFGP
jgi:hypothetical protein